ncbi:MAG TPA: hypothetical protein VMF59_13670, partial [Bacteroidota bacterium]|nr:hypothetical protein [Bacteroidota bacterium]
MKFKDLWIKPPTDEGDQGDVVPRAPGSVPPPVQASAPADDDATAPFVAQLEEALEKANLPSQQDYLDFAKALRNMGNLPMDEPTKYRAAFATLQSFGCNLHQ